MPVYNAAAAGKRLSGTGIYTLPAATVTTLASGAGAWVNGAYTQLSAAIANNIYLLGAVFEQPYNQQTPTMEVDIAVGAAGFETVIATISLSTVGSSTVPAAIVHNLALPYPIASGARVSARLRTDAAIAKNANITLQVCNQSDVVNY